MHMIHYWSRRKAQHEAILKLYRKSPDIAAISKLMNVSVPCVRYSLKKSGVKHGKKHIHRAARCSQNKDLVLRMCDEGYGFSAIARAVHTNKRTVRRFLREHGVTREFPKYAMGEFHHAWKGGRIIDKDGYVMILVRDHPERRKHSPYVLEHRLMMEKMIGRYLLLNEVVHHRNKNKQDNRPENLQLFSENKDHLAQELKGKVPNWTADGKERIRKGVIQSSIVKRAQKLLKSKLDAQQLP